MFVEAQVGIQARHADISAGLARDVIGVGFPETAFVKNVFRQFDYVDVIMVAARVGHLLQTELMKRDCARGREIAGATAKSRGPGTG